MNLLIQYQQADQSWSPWTPCHLDGAKLMVNGEELSTSPVRVLKNQDPKNPDVSWYARHEQTLYEIKKSNTGFIEKATPLPNQMNNKSIPVKSITGDFSLKSFEEMKESAKDHLYL